MREAVPFLDTNQMEWEVGEMPGLFTKLLSRDPETGARTALQCIDPSRGYNAPAKPHYHDDDEEIFLVKGKFSFDGETWLAPYSYCFHPTRTVHGFRSEVAEESWFLSRVSKPIAFSFSDDYRDLVPYSLDGNTPARTIAVLPRPLESDEWEDVRDAEGKVILRRLLLSRHPQTGEGSMLVEFMPGWVSPHGDHYHSVYEEAFVMRGEIEAADGTLYVAGCYSFKPPFTAQSALSSPGGALVYINFGGPLDFRPLSDLARVESV